MVQEHLPCLSLGPTLTQTFSAGSAIPAGSFPMAQGPRPQALFPYPTLHTAPREFLQGGSEPA